MNDYVDMAFGQMTVSNAYDNECRPLFNKDDDIVLEVKAVSGSDEDSITFAFSTGYREDDYSFDVPIEVAINIKDALEYIINKKKKGGGE